jgi:[ribosomal protein S18]-alanine N-acetyltransferase
MANLQPVLRAYISSDRKQIINLLRLNTPEFFNEAEEKDLLRYLEHQMEDYFVIELEGSIIGAGGINYFPQEEVARISWDLIHPDHHRQGVGKQLLFYRLKKINSQPLVNKVVVRTSQLVFGFYEKMGFTTEYVEKDYWAKGLDLHVMKMEKPFS